MFRAGLSASAASKAASMVGKHRDRRFGLEIGRVLPDHLQILRAADFELGLRLRRVSARQGEPAAGLIDIGLRHLADGVFSLHLLQLPLQRLHRVAVNVEHRHVAAHAHVGGDGLLQHLDFGLPHRLPLLQDIGLGLIHRRMVASAGIERLRDRDAEGAGVGALLAAWAEDALPALHLLVGVAAGDLGLKTIAGSGLHIGLVRRRLRCALRT